MNNSNQVRVTWKTLFHSSRAKWMLMFCILALAFIILYLPLFYQNVIGPKPGILVHDVVLNALRPINFSIPIFTLIYLTILHTFLTNLRYPVKLLLGLCVYLAVSLLRMLAMYIITFEPPQDMILLIDPVTSHFYPDAGFAKDLFFSGHISTLTLMVLLEKDRIIKWIKIVATTIVGIFLAWQHVHYTLDLLVAPFITWAVYKLCYHWLLTSSKNID